MGSLEYPQTRAPFFCEGEWLILEIRDVTSHEGSTRASLGGRGTRRADDGSLASDERCVNAVV